MAKGKKIIQGISENFLTPTEVKFLDHYVAEGMQNAYASYMHATGCKEKTARTNAYRVLQRPHVMEELKARIEASGITKAWIVQNARVYVRNGVDNQYYANAGQKALEMLAKHSGMLDETIHHKFSEGNPAVFVAPYTKEEAEEIAKTGRIQE
jgi:hypothetical protein